MNSSNEMDDLRLYLIGTSKQEQFIQKRTSLMTGKECFFLNEKQNFLVLFSDLDAPSSINRDSQVESEYIINFRLQISCWIPNAYILSINKDTFKCLDKETQKDLNEGENEQEQGITAHIGSMNLVKSKNIDFYDSQGESHIGTLIYKNFYTYNIDEPNLKINIIDKLPDQLKTVYMYARYMMNMDITSLINIRVFSPSIGDIPVDLYSFDIYNLADGITISNELHDDVGILIYVNRVIYETIAEAMRTNKNYYLGSNRLAKINLNIGGVYLDAIVKSFENKSEYYTSDVNKSLKIRTAVGTGYISLVEENPNNHNAYKICVGYDGDTPIIREFETE